MPPHYSPLFIRRRDKPNRRGRRKRPSPPSFYHYQTHVSGIRGSHCVVQGDKKEGEEKGGTKENYYASRGR
jgi:hypothetical protein